MQEDVDVPLILGRPFLAIGKAMINVQQGQRSLRIQDEEIIFKMSDAMKNAPSSDDFCYLIDAIGDAVNACFQEGIVLGHKISQKGIEVDKAKVEAIEKLPPPSSVGSVRSFLGHVGFYRKFIKDFSKIAKPLSTLLQKEVAFEFSLECLQAFNTLKDKLINAPIMIAPDWTLPFELMCDASDSAVGAVLG
ncbi:PREDICTED: uncharacterized protein LOC109114178 [Nelumbo nucifera]|uniref:Uncharacterized protein LOC109114178 n=1 Tax=Nelumbo nucifera TaxID=4432 RepID=A0A1U8Q1Q3_NELNU|nr:PREDICTED: uncharacterized protein LOC109114178 [Nelumbo nucifera]